MFWMFPVRFYERYRCVSKNHEASRLAKETVWPLVGRSKVVRSQLSPGEGFACLAGWSADSPPDSVLWRSSLFWLPLNSPQMGSRERTSCLGKQSFLGALPNSSGWRSTTWKGFQPTSTCPALWWAALWSWLREEGQEQEKAVPGRRREVLQGGRLKENSDIYNKTALSCSSYSYLSYY